MPVTGQTSSEDVEVRLESATPGASIFYRLDGSMPIPGLDGTLRFDSGDPIVIGGNGTSVHIVAIAIGPSMYPSVIAERVMTITYGTVVAPQISPISSGHFLPVVVTMSSTTPGAALFYTLDGSDPRTSMTRIEYGDPFVVAQSTTVNAVAEREGYLSSDVVSRTYTIGSGSLYDDFSGQSLNEAIWGSALFFGGRLEHVPFFTPLSGNDIETGGTLNFYGHTGGWTGSSRAWTLGSSTAWSLEVVAEYMNGGPEVSTQGWSVQARDIGTGARVALFAHQNKETSWKDGVGSYHVTRSGNSIEVYRDGQLIRSVDASSLPQAFGLYITADNAYGSGHYSGVAIDNVRYQP